jgi:hypothetical protein
VSSRTILGKAGLAPTAVVLLAASACLVPSSVLLDPSDQITLCVTTDLPPNTACTNAATSQVTVVATAPDPADSLPPDATVILTVSSGWLLEGGNSVGSIALPLGPLGQASAIWCMAADGGPSDAGDDDAGLASGGGTPLVSAMSGPVSASVCVGPGCDAGC